MGINFHGVGAHHGAMHHDTHLAGTVNDCPGCRDVAYEPSWYAALMAFEAVSVPQRADVTA